MTLYRLQDSQVIRTVVRNCFFQYREALTDTTNGLQHKRPFLLVIPGNTASVMPGDRVICGEGPFVTAQMWHSFVPALVEGLVQVGCVTPYYLAGRLCHTEAKEAL